MAWTHHLLSATVQRTGSAGSAHPEDEAAALGSFSDMVSPQFSLPPGKMPLLIQTLTKANI